MADDKVKTHGDFALAATLATGLKERILFAAGEDKLDPVSRETLDQIVSRIARIVYGESHHAKHWLDIIGFCQARLDVLVRQEVKEIRAPLELERDIRSLVTKLPRNNEG
jgi:hypothetical protein